MKKFNCKNCGKFIIVKWTGNKFCNNSCSASFNNKKTKFKHGKFIVKIINCKE